MGGSAERRAARRRAVLQQPPSRIEPIVGRRPKQRRAAVRVCVQISTSRDEDGQDLHAVRFARPDQRLVQDFLLAVGGLPHRESAVRSIEPAAAPGSRRQRAVRLETFVNDIDASESRGHAQVARYDRNVREHVGYFAVTPEQRDCERRATFAVRLPIRRSACLDEALRQFHLVGVRGLMQWRPSTVIRLVDIRTGPKEHVEDLPGLRRGWFARPASETDGEIQQRVAIRAACADHVWVLLDHLEGRPTDLVVRRFRKRRMPLPNLRQGVRPTGFMCAHESFRLSPSSITARQLSIIRMFRSATILMLCIYNGQNLRSPERFSADFQVCLPYRGLCVWHVADDDVVGDPNQVLFVSGGGSFYLSQCRKRLR